MASAVQQPIPGKYGALRDLYLGLWEQLDLVSGEGKWLDPRPADAQELSAYVQQRVNQARGHLQGGEMQKIREDFDHTQSLLETSPRDPEFQTFKIYLRDEGLRYARAVRGQ